MALAGGVPLRGIQERYVQLLAEYRLQCAEGVVPSVRAQYERRLAALRDQLRSWESPHKLGDILMRLGAIDNARLEQALEIQSTQEKSRLLGEVLVDLGWVDESTVHQAVEVQISAPVVYQTSEQGIGTA